MKISDFDRVYQKYVDLVHYAAYSMVRDYHLAQDVCQEVFIKMYRAIDGLDEKSIKGWLLVVSRLTAIDNLRKRTRRREANPDPEEKDTYHEPYTPDRILDDFLLREFAGNHFLALYEKNKEWYEIVMRLDVEGAPTAEVAQELGLSINHLRVKHHRARAWLREHFGKELRELL